MTIVSRFSFFREVARGGFAVARSGSSWLLVAFCGFFERWVALNWRVGCNEVVSYTKYGLHTADVAATGVLLLQNYSRPRPRRELLVLHPELTASTEPDKISNHHFQSSPISRDSIHHHVALKPTYLKRLSLDTPFLSQPALPVTSTTLSKRMTTLGHDEGRARCPTSF